VMTFSSGTHNICVGLNAGSELTTQNNVLAIGDDCHASCDNEVVVGQKLFGRFIPPAVRRAILDHPVFIRFLIKKLTGQ